jgi:OOP family OmpA-OmpF porin
MRYLMVAAFVFAVHALAYSSSIASEEITQESAGPPPDSALFNRLCEDLMKQVLQQSNVRFAESSAKLGGNAHGALDEIAEIAADCPALSLIVTGHTDTTGNESANKELSRARAESVVAYLTERGIEPKRLTASGAGSDSPIANNDDAAGRQVNRRIEFALSFP